MKNEMRFTAHESELFTADCADEELVGGLGEGRGVLFAEVYSVAPVRYYDSVEKRVVESAPKRWCAEFQMDAEDRFGGTAIRSGHLETREDAEEWVAAMLGRS